MKSSGMVLKGALALVVLGLLVGIVGGGVFSKKAMPLVLPMPMPLQITQTTALPVFAAPSQVASGESWVLLGSTSDLPKDLIVTSAALGVEVVEVQTISAKAVGVHINVTAGTLGKILKVSSASSGSEAYPDVYVGQPPGSRTGDANLQDSDFVNGKLPLEGNQFIYGYFPQEGLDLAAVRIHNRATGAWVTHEIAAAKAEEAAAAAAAPALDDPAFQVVDVYQTLPDTNGDGIYDFQEAPEVKPAVPEQMGVELASGLNTLDLVAVDGSGNASWRTIDVFTTYVPDNK